MTDSPAPQDQSIWDAFPVGVILPWYSTSSNIPANMKGKWEFFTLSDGKFLRGSDFISDKVENNLGGKQTHAHNRVAKNLGPGSGEGFESEGNHVTFGHTEEVDHTPPFLAVRYIIRV